jgi:hypothetical protein
MTNIPGKLTYCRQNACNSSKHSSNQEHKLQKSNTHRLSQMPKLIKTKTKTKHRRSNKIPKDGFMVSLKKYQNTNPTNTKSTAKSPSHSFSKVRKPTIYSKMYGQWYWYFYPFNKIHCGIMPDKHLYY